ncbi:MAG: FGGY family carbohydrate kinase [Bacteroidales bacterium]
MFLLAIDQSTSATKVMLVDREGRIRDRVTLAHEQFYPAPGYVEHDAVEIYGNVLEGIRRIREQHRLDHTQIACISITNQRETALIWDKETGTPVARAAVWQCQRGADYCRVLQEKGHGDRVREKTGLLLDPYFSASKLHRIMADDPSLKERAARGELLAGTMDSWLLWKLTGGKVHATDYSNACRTLLFNIRTLDWDGELVALFGLHPSMLPEVRFSDEVFGTTEPGTGFEAPVPIGGLMGDSHAALFGQLCTAPGMGKATYGTGSSFMLNVGTACPEAPGGLVSSIGFARDRTVHYVLEGNIHFAPEHTINWLKNPTAAHRRCLRNGGPGLGSRGQPRLCISCRPLWVWARPTGTTGPGPPSPACRATPPGPTWCGRPWKASPTR